MRKTRKERREEEARILAEMDEALREARGERGKTQENAAEKETEKGNDTQAPTYYDGSVPEQMHCRRCGNAMEKGKCPVCGFTVYMPMDEGTRKKVRLITGVVLVALFAVLFVWLNAKG